MKIFPLVILIFMGLGLNAQSIEKCAFDRLHQKLLQQPAVKKAVEENERNILKYKNSAESRSSAIVTIPVVVHVFHCGEAIGAASGGGLGANLPIAQITSAIANLNEAFSHTGIYGDGMHNGYTANTNARFALAATAPDGSATNGILRVDLSGQTWGTTYCSEGMDAGLGGGVPEATVKAVSRWPASDYMNIWLVHKIENGGTCSGTLGFASFPGTTAGTTDGLTVLSGAFGYDPTGAAYPNTLCPSVNLNGTADHEVGHYLNLFHTFEGDNNGMSCPTSPGDHCSDIPAHIRSSGCPADNPTGNACVTPNGPNAYIHNFMDYVDDLCYHGFSNDQKTRVDAAIASTGPRAALGTSLGDSAPMGPYPTAASCSPVPSAAGSAGPVNISLNGTTWISSNAGFDGGSYNRVASQSRVALETGQTYSIGVDLASSGHCNVYIDYNDDGDFMDTDEMIHDSPAALSSHSISFTVPASGPTLNKNIRLRIIGDSGDVTDACSALSDGQAEDYSVILSAPLPIELSNFSANAVVDAIMLEWTTQSEVDNLGFELQRSDNTENDFETIQWVTGKGNSITPSKYSYADDQVQKGQYYYYRLKQIDLAGTFSFSDIVSAKLLGDYFDELKIVPNPASDEIAIQFGTANDQVMTIEIYSLDGKKWMHQKIVPNTTQMEINIAHLPTGIYFAKIADRAVLSINKLIKN